MVYAPGSFHDAAIWRISEIKQYLEMRFPRRYILGDSAFSITDNMIIPYTRRQSAEDVERALFNHRQSKARVEMTEDTFGMWKKRWPIIDDLRLHVENAMAVIEATAILHNISLEWGDIMQRNMYVDSPPALYPQDPDEEELVVINNVPAGESRDLRPGRGC